MPIKVSEKQKKEILESFKNGTKIKELSINYNFTISTITRHLKKILGEEVFIEIRDNNFRDKNNFENSQENFFEIVPIIEEEAFIKQKDISSRPISEVKLPKTAFMIVGEKIELVSKLLAEYPEWSFLPDVDLNRNIIEIFSDQKLAKKVCARNQKVIKIPDTKVLLITSGILKSRGITRIIMEDLLISL